MWEGRRMFYTQMETTAALEGPYTLPASVPASPYALVVEDDKAILSAVMFLLELEGYAGLAFSDSPKVLPFLEQVEPKHLPSVILLDLMMPTVSGYEIAAQLSQHEQFAHVPIIIMTADNRVHNAAAVPGASDWLAKPFQIEALLTKIENYLPSPSN
jgi:CheY-like chemotaxis protein